MDAEGTVKIAIGLFLVILAAITRILRVRFEQKREETGAN